MAREWPNHHAARLAHSAQLASLKGVPRVTVESKKCIQSSSLVSSALSSVSVLSLMGIIGFCSTRSFHVEMTGSAAVRPIGHFVVGSGKVNLSLDIISYVIYNALHSSPTSYRTS